MANKKIKLFYNNVAAALGLELCEEKLIVSGIYKGYDVAIRSLDLSRTPYALVLTTSVQGSGDISPDDRKAIHKAHKLISNITLKDCVLTITFSSLNFAKADTLEEFKRSVYDAIEFIRSKGYTPCCSNCKQAVDTCDYLLRGNPTQLCDGCAQQLTISAAADGANKASKKENIIAGTVGALLGSLAGVACIVILGQLGYVSAISGVIMAVCVLKLYEKFAGKTGVAGIIICIIVMLVMTWIGNKLDWAIYLSREFTLNDINVNIFDCYMAIPDLIAEGIIEKSTFYANMTLCYLFLLLGFIPTLISNLKAKKEPVIIKIGGPYVHSDYDLSQM